MKTLKYSALILILLLVACRTPPAPLPEPATTEPETTNTAVSESVPQEEPVAIEAIPTEESATETAVLQSNLNEFTYNNISFKYNNSLATGVTVETALPPERQFLGPRSTNHPITHDQFTFEKYILPKRYPAASIDIYPVLETSSRNHFSKAQIESLQKILAAYPEGKGLPDKLPYLPWPNVSQFLYAHAEYLPFASGEGIRYVARFGDLNNPITNQGLHYAFQGLTSDGQYYISALFPIRTNVLPDEPPTDLDYEALSANYDLYIEEIVETLNTQTSIEFFPDLTWLDDVAQSITIAHEPHRTDENGNKLLTIEFPVNNGQAIIGEEITVSGYAPLNSNIPISVTLTASGNRITETVAALDPATGNWAARQTFTVTGGGSWNGTILLPVDIEDPFACASVYTGTAGEVWVEVQKSLPILLPTDEQAIRLQIANQQPIEFKAGENALISGMAVKAPEVKVSIKNNETQDMLVEGIATVGDFGLWEIELLIPEDAPDLVMILVEILDDPARETPYFLTIGLLTKRFT